MSLYKGHRCDIWKPTANIKDSGAVLTGTYVNIYQYVDCRYHNMTSVEKIQAGAIDLSIDMRDVFFNGNIIDDLKIFYILHFYDDDTNWLIDQPINHITATRNYYSAMIKYLHAAPREVISFV